LVVSPRPISLGTLEPGRASVTTLTLHNPGPRPIIVERAETSCPCVSVSALPVSVRPNSTARLEVTFDPADEPDFRGRLAVDILGRGSGDVVLFRATVVVTVALSRALPPPVPDRPRG